MAKMVMVGKDEDFLLDADEVISVFVDNSRNVEKVSILLKNGKILKTNVSFKEVRKAVNSIVMVRE